RHQDRYLMTAQPPFCKAARLPRRLSTGHGRTHPDVSLSSPIGRHLAAFDAARHSFIGRATFAQLAASVRTQSARSPAALKSPWSLPHRFCPPCAVSSLGGFRTPTARICRAINHAAGIRNPSQIATSNLFEGWSGLRRIADAARVRVKVSSGPISDISETKEVTL